MARARSGSSSVCPIAAPTTPGAGGGGASAFWSRAGGGDDWQAAKLSRLKDTHNFSKNNLFLLMRIEFLSFKSNKEIKVRLIL
jgi:hypothetical protein